MRRKSFASARRPLCRRSICSAFNSLAFIVLAQTIHGAIDLIPVPSERNVEGVVFKQLVFRETERQIERQITYQQPTGWTYSGGKNALRLAPPEMPQVRAEIEQSPLPIPQVLDAATINLLRDQEMRRIPGSEEVTLVLEEQSPLRFKGRDTYGLTLSYLLHGQRYTSNVLFANLEDTQLRFRVVAPTDQFEKVFKSFRGSLFTLQGL